MESCSIASSIYNTLKSGEIRLLTLAPSKTPEAEIRIRPSTCSLQSGHYKALSYVCSNPTVCKDVFVNEKRWQIDVDLYSALQEVRHSNKPQNIWISSICVNKFDAEEESQQKTMRGDIYRHASDALVWLGPRTEMSPRQHTFSGAENERLAIDVLHSLATTKKMPITPLQPLSLQHESGFRDLFGRGWFKQIWCVQEAVLAKRLTFIYGDRRVRWAAGTETVRLIRRLKFAAISPYWFGDKPQPRTANAGYPVCKDIFEPLLKLLELSATNTLGRRPKADILDSMYAMRHRRAHDPRDIIYGLLSLGPTPCQRPLPVDYSLQVDQVWAQLLDHLRTCPSHPPIDRGSWTGPSFKKERWPAWTDGIKHLDYDRVTVSIRNMTWLRLRQRMREYWPLYLG